MTDYRGVGTTTKQMRAAKQRAHFVWINAQLQYPRRMAEEMGRGDLNIVSPDFFTSGRWHGHLFTEIVVDHAVHRTDALEQNLLMARPYVGRTR